MTAPIRKTKGVDYRCQDCGLVVTVKKATGKTPNGELICCNDIMKTD